MTLCEPCVPEPCDDEIYENGETVFVTSTIPAMEIEVWVKKVAERSGQRVDWHFVGGRAVVRALGDIEAVKRAIQELLPEHDALYAKACEGYGVSSDPPRWP